MSVIDLMQPSASGMIAQSNRLSTIADNIANASTVGYKRADAQFAAFLVTSDQFTNIRGDTNMPAPETMYGWGSVQTNIRHLIDRQGALAFTNSSTDLAVEGQGFFVVTDPNLSAQPGSTANTFLTRAGSFVENADGYLINAGGYELMGYDLSNGTAPSGVSDPSSLTPICLTDIASSPEPTTEGKFYVNLDSRASALPPGANSPAANQADSVYTSMSSLAVYDNNGDVVTLDIYTTKMNGTAPYAWEVDVFNHADAAQGGSTYFPYSGAEPLVTTTLTFDQYGKYTSGSPVEIPVPGGATLALDMSKSTQVAAPYEVSKSSVNGYPASDLDHVEVTKEGVVRAYFAAGNYVDAYQIPLANVFSPNNLTVISNGNVFQANGGLPPPAGDGSGQVEVAPAGENGNGVIRSEMLEQAAVDVGAELTDMITAQRAFQLNSQGFQVGDEATQTIIALR